MAREYPFSGIPGLIGSLVAWVMVMPSDSVAQRRERIIAMHDAGMSFTRIAQAEGLSKTRVSNLYAHGIRDREKRKDLEAQVNATLDTPIERCGLGADVTYALASMGFVDLRGVLACDERDFTAEALTYTNVGRRALLPLAKIRDRLANAL